MDKNAYISHYGPNHPSLFNILKKASFSHLERLFLAARRNQRELDRCDEYIEMMLRYSRHWWLNDIHKQLTLIHDDLQIHNSSQLKKHFETLYVLIEKILDQNKSL